MGSQPPPLPLLVLSPRPLAFRGSLCLSPPLPRPPAINGGGISIHFPLVPLPLLLLLEALVAGQAVSRPLALARELVGGGV